jgi:hypothetical protein
MMRNTSGGLAWDRATGPKRSARISECNEGFVKLSTQRRNPYFADGRQPGSDHRDRALRDSDFVAPPSWRTVQGEEASKRGQRANGRALNNFWLARHSANGSGCRKRQVPFHRLLSTGLLNLAALLSGVLPGCKRSIWNYLDVSELSIWTASTCCPPGDSRVR